MQLRFPKSSYSLRHTAPLEESWRGRKLFSFVDCVKNARSSGAKPNLFRRVGWLVLADVKRWSNWLRNSSPDLRFFHFGWWPSFYWTVCHKGWATVFWLGHRMKHSRTKLTSITHHVFLPQHLLHSNNSGGCIAVPWQFIERWTTMWWCWTMTMVM